MEEIIKELRNIMIEAALRDKNYELVERLLVSEKRLEELRKNKGGIINGKYR